jgi:hypothetical protein
MLSAAALLVLAMASGVTDTIFVGDFESPGTCPTGQQTRANFAYASDGGFRQRLDVDVTEWANIWGHATALDDALPWPGNSFSTPIFLNFARSTYIAAHFQVPPGTPSTWYGWIVHTEYNYGADITTAISTRCGDFDPTDAACFSAGTSGQNMGPWRTASTGNLCHVPPPGDYYLNMKFRDPTISFPNCAVTDATCSIGTANQFNEP